MASAARSGFLRGRPHPARGAAILPVLALCLGAANACRTAPPDDLTVEWRMPSAGAAANAPATGSLVLLDPRQRGLTGARLAVTAHMTHPGMPPVAAAVRERGGGTYDVRLTFTMAGDWVLHVSGVLADGRPVDQWVEVRGVAP